MKIGLITMHRSDNYGAVLQTYALMKYIAKNGHDIEIIDYVPNRFRTSVQFFYVHPRRYKSLMQKLIIMLCSLPIRGLIKIRYSGFNRNYIKIGTKRYYSNDELKKECPKCDIYLTGSDQVWNSDFEGAIDKAYFLAFVPDALPKIAYAGSFGKDTLNEEEKTEIRNLLKRYDALSVREKSGLAIMQDLGIENCEYLLDPTFLLNANEWNEISGKQLLKDKYLLIYQLNPNPELLCIAMKIAEERNLKVVKFGRDVIKQKGVDVNLAFKKPNDFIAAIKDAEYIVTDSFHGTAFSVNFHKEFTVVMPPKYSGRLTSILEKLDLMDRVEKESYKHMINYEKIDKILDFEREKAYKFIDENIFNPLRSTDEYKNNK